jgi:hypothetical protein
VASLRDTLIHGGLLDAIPPQAAFMIFGLPSEPYVPMMSTGEGSNIVCAGRVSFIFHSSLIDVDCLYFDEFHVVGSTG